jgi:hypothetical protein
VSLLTLFYFVSFDTRNILFNSQCASGHSRSTIHIPFQIINVLETTSTSESSASPSPQHRRRYKVTAVAARPKSHVPINRIMGGIVLGYSEQDIMENTFVIVYTVAVNAKELPF